MSAATIFTHLQMHIRMTAVFFIKLGLSLGIGLLVARRLRGLIQKGVTRSIPMKDRMAEDFLNQLSRKSAFVGIGLALVLSGLLYWGMSSVWDKGVAPLVSASGVELETPLPSASPAPVDLPAPIVKEEQTTAVERELPATVAPQVPRPAPAPARQNSWYIQLGAFNMEANAYSVLQTQSPGAGLRVYLAESGDAAKWKILLGPFPSAQAARAYRNQHGIPGFPRSAVGLRLL